MPARRAGIFCAVFDKFGNWFRLMRGSDLGTLLYVSEHNSSQRVTALLILHFYRQNQRPEMKVMIKVGVMLSKL